ncbi:MAG TPA: hypothetical protein VGK73_22400 [Polyangiaceae bacterium]
MTEKRVNLVASDSEGRLHHYYTPLTKEYGAEANFGWSSEAGHLEDAGLIRLSGGLAMACFDRDVDLFWVTQAGNLGHKHAEDLRWQPAQSGDDPEYVHLRPLVGIGGRVEAVSPKPNRVEVFAVSSTGGFEHVWYDESTSKWGTPDEPHKEHIALEQPVRGLATVSVGDGFDLFVDIGSAAARLRNRDGVWELSKSSLVTQLITFSAAPFATLPATLQDAIMWEHDIFDLLITDAEERLWDDYLWNYYPPAQGFFVGSGSAAPPRK